MDDFDKFVRFVKDGKLKEVMTSFRQEFLERTDDYKKTPIYYACRKKHIEIAKFLIEKKCNLEFKDDSGWRVIHHACDQGCIDVAELLIGNSCEIECEDNAGWRPIHHASSRGHVDIVKLLINKGSELQCKTKIGLTPLELARRDKRHACEDYLIEAVKFRQVKH